MIPGHGPVRTGVTIIFPLGKGGRNAVAGGPVAEGNVGGGTGMVAYQIKGGIGTASRVFAARGTHYTVGVLLQANNGRRKDLRIAGIPIGEEIPDLLPRSGQCRTDKSICRDAHDHGAEPAKSSLLVVIATDAPLDARQVARLARRAALGVGRTGGTANDFSGEFALAYSTVSTFPWGAASLKRHQRWSPSSSTDHPKTAL